VSDDMGSFRVDIEIENPARPGEKRTLRSVLVDTGAELSWVPAEALESLGIERCNKWHFRQANGTILERWAGGARSPKPLRYQHLAGSLQFKVPLSLIFSVHCAAQEQSPRHHVSASRFCLPPRNARSHH
jgi:hypothetical protein